MKKSKKVIKENLGSYSPYNYPATNTPPRKDFVPFNKRDGYNYPYQSNNDSFLPSSPVPQSPSSMPWELNFVIDDLADSYIYLTSAISKLSNCSKYCLTLDKDQKSKLFHLYKAAKKASEVIKKIGMNVEDISNMAEQPTPDLMNPLARKTIKRN